MYPSFSGQVYNCVQTIEDCRFSTAVQGESDAFELEHASSYGANFTAWLATTRAALLSYSPCVPLVMVVMATRQRELAFPHIAVVRQAQWDLEAPCLLKVRGS